MEGVICNPEFRAKISKSYDGTKYMSSLYLNIDRGDHKFDCNDYEELRDVDVIDKDFYFGTSREAKTVKTLVLSKGIKKITDSAFQKNTEISTVVWPDACDEIPFCAFDGSEIEALLNTDHVKRIGYRALAFTRIKTFNGRNITEISSEAFNGCAELKSFNVPENVETIPEACFINCLKLSEVSGLEKVHFFEKKAFYNCSSLQYIPALDKAFSIGPYSFYKTSIERVDLGRSICSSIGEWAFAFSHLNACQLGYFPCEIGNNAFIGTKYGEEVKNGRSNQHT